jgi:hypothetical protein
MRNAKPPPQSSGSSSKPPTPTDPCHSQGGGRLQRRTEQELHCDRGETEERKTGHQFNHRGCGLQSFHGSEPIEREGTEKLLLRAFRWLKLRFHFLCVLIGRFAFDCQLADAPPVGGVRAFEEADPQRLGC